MTYDAYDSLRFAELPDDVLQVTIDNPRHALNVVDDPLHHDLTRLFAELRRDSDHRAVVLHGAGRAFSAGGSFDWFETLDSPRRLYELQRDARQLIWDLLDVELPIVTAVHGHAVGLGASIALLSDVIFMSESAKLADPHVCAGIVAGDGGVVAWPLAIGPARAKAHLMTGDPVDAATACSWGLVNQVVPDDELLTAATAFAQRLAKGAPMAVRYTKLAVNKLVKQSLNVSFDASTAYEMSTFQSADHKEAVRAFKERRAPNFTGN